MSFDSGGGGFESFAPAVQGIGGVFQGLQGSKQQSQSLLSAAESVRGAAAFNIQVVNINLQRQLEALSQELRTTLSTQTAQSGGSGLAIASGSFQSIFTETSNQILKEQRHARQDAEIERRRIQFEAESQAIALQNRAAAARLQGRQDAFQGISRLFGQ